MIELATFLAFVGTFLWWIIVLVPWQPWNTQESLDATNDEKHFVNRNVQEELIVENQGSGQVYRLQAPLIIFNR